MSRKFDSLLLCCRKEDDVDKKHTGKVKTKEVVNEEALVEVKLPSVALTVDKLPKIDISVPPPPPVITVSKPKPVTVSASCTVTASSEFAFSKPTMVSVSVSCPADVPTSTFTFSRPLSVSSSASVSSTVKSRTSNVSPKQLKSIDIKSAVTTLNSLTNASVQATECKVCKAKLDKPSAPCPVCKPAEKPKSDFGDLMKKQTGGTWECSVCMIRNKNDANKCVACETMKPAPKSAAVTTKPVPPAVSTTSTGFGEMFKKPTGSWECDACMLRNEPGSTKCVACETPKPGAKISNDPKPLSVPLATGSGFGDLFKKPAGSWTCKECMVTNDSNKVKCVACETVKPGATLPKPTESSAPKFSFGIPSSATPTVGSSSTFSFGVNHVDQSKPATTVPSDVTVLKDKSQASVTPQTFQFGIPKSTKVESDGSAEVSSSSSIKSTFQFGTSTAATTVDTKFSFGSSSTTSKPNATESLSVSVNKRKLEEETKSEPAKLAFSLPSKSATDVTVSVNSATESPKLANDVSGTTTLAKSSSTPSPMFAFGSANTQNLAEKSTLNSQAKPFQSGFMFEAKQGSNFPSSTTNTLSTSVSSNVFKFGDTKTVPSGSTAASVYAVSSQPSVTPAVSKPNNIFSFGSSASTEKKEITFGATKATETPLVSTSANDSKPVFAFGSSTTPAFGSANATPTFGTTGAFNVKKDEPSPFAPQTATTNMFGLTQAPSVTPSTTFSGFGQNNAFATPTQENKASPVFSFGSAAPKETTQAPVGGFAFSGDQAVEKPAAPAFNFGGAQTNLAPSMFNSTPSASFNFEPKGFGGAAATPSPFAVNNDVQAPVFGAAVPQPAPTAVFNFGSQPALAPAAPMFNFSNQVNVNLTISSKLHFFY